MSRSMGVTLFCNAASTAKYLLFCGKIYYIYNVL